MRPHLRSILAALAAVALAALAAGCAEDPGSLLAPAEPPGGPGEAGGPSCPSVPVSIVRAQVPPHVCVPPEPLPVQILKEANAFWGSQIEICRCGPDTAAECAEDAFATFDAGWIYYDPALVNQLFASRDLLPVHWMIGHEIGHEIQGHLTGLPGGELATELEADCLSGYYLGSHVCQGRIDEAELAEVLGGACASSDRGWLEPASHGDCDARIEATLRGARAYLAGESALDACRT